jgi:hypothetical protein
LNRKWLKKKREKEEEKKNFNGKGVEETWQDIFLRLTFRTWARKKNQLFLVALELIFLFWNFAAPARKLDCS